MKRTFTILLVLLFGATGFTQRVNIAKWTFPTGNESDLFPDQANTLNADKSISTTGVTSAIAFKNGATTKAAQASGWNNGQDVKSWQVEINTTGYTKILVSSKQTAGGSNPGPRDFKLQYRIGSAGEWSDITGSTIVVGNDWITGAFSNLPLPDDCANQGSLYLRWIMTSNLDVAGNTLAANGIAKIDDISVTGEAASGIETSEAIGVNVNLYPNPCADHLLIESEKELNRIELYNLVGMKVTDLEIHACSTEINMAGYPVGRYFVVVHTKGGMESVVRSVMKN